MEILLQVVLLLVGFMLLVKGADFFVDGASGIADKFGIPQLVIGLTIVAMGTSLPEASVSITAALKHSADISIGNVVGSNILNILLILGITAMVTPVMVQKSTVKVEIPYMMGVTVLLLAIGGMDNTVSALDGMILWIFFLIYLGYLFRMAKAGKEEPKEEKKQLSMWKLFLYTVGGMAIIIIGSNFTVDAATILAQKLGISERLIGLTIVAFGTSLPELVTSVTAAKKGNADIAIGNIVGSNIFNILFILGSAALITPIPFASNFRVDTVFAIIVGLILFLCVCKDYKLKRSNGIILLLFEGAYIMYLVAAA
ncbi:MAG: calcium/sodium antiporter [Lachnospiraceae bacterium]|nr:calcium/sodium antiporter [Lachnospiraceae bacterium]